MLIDSLFKNATETPDALAVIDDQGEHKYAQLASLADAVANQLKNLTSADTVALLLPPGAAYISAFYGILLSGKAVVPVNYLLGSKEIGHLLKDSGADTLISAQHLIARMRQTLPGGEAIAQELIGSGMKLLDISTIPVAEHFPKPEELPKQNPDDLAVLLYTSGTSGLPKGALLSYGNLQSDVDAAIQHAALTHQHRFLGVVPLFHSFGMTAMMLAPIQLATTTIYLQRFSPVACLQAIRQHKVSLLFGVPSMFAAIGRLKDAKPEDFAPMHALISGGEPLSPAIRELFMTRFSKALLEGYGLTETSPILALNTPQAHKTGSVGLPLPTAEIRIADENNGPLARNVEGEIQVRGPMVFQGYHNLPDVTAAAFTPDGYFRTGDLGHLDEDGFLFITGRLKDLIIISGEKLHPREVEDLLVLQPAVAEAAVVSRKDPSRGEAPVAFYTLREGAEAPTAQVLMNHLRDQHLIPWKIPKEFIQLKEFPRNATGKVLKRELVKLLPPA